MVLLDQSFFAKNGDCAIYRFGFPDATLPCDGSAGRERDAGFRVDVLTDTAIHGDVARFQPVRENVVIDEKEVFAFCFHRNRCVTQTAIPCTASSPSTGISAYFSLFGFKIFIYPIAEILFRGLPQIH